MEEIEVLKQYIEELGLHEKEGITVGDWSALRSRLRETDEFGLADYVERLGSPEELEDLIVNNLYC